MGAIDPGRGGGGDPKGPESADGSGAGIDMGAGAGKNGIPAVGVELGRSGPLKGLSTGGGRNEACGGTDSKAVPVRNLAPDEGASGGSGMPGSAVKVGAPALAVCASGIWGCVSVGGRRDSGAGGGAPNSCSLLKPSTACDLAGAGNVGAGEPGGMGMLAKGSNDASGLVGT